MEPGLQRELIVIVENRPSSNREIAAALPRAAVPGLDTLEQQIAKSGGILKPGFRTSSVPIAPAFAVPSILPAHENTPGSPPDLSAFFRVTADDDRLEELTAVVRQHPAVLSAYIQPATYLPILNKMLPASTAPPFSSPDFTPDQGYLDLPELGTVETDFNRGCLDYLIFPVSGEVIVETILQSSGEVHCLVGIMENPHALVLWPGGWYQGKHLVGGALVTNALTDETSKLYTAFIRALTKGFVVVRDFANRRWWVGPEAMRALYEGKRLITESNSDTFDLKPPERQA